MPCIGQSETAHVQNYCEILSHSILNYCAVFWHLKTLKTHGSILNHISSSYRSPSSALFLVKQPVRMCVCVCVPNEDVDGLAVIGAKHNVGGTQEGLQDVYNTWRHLLHLIKKEDRASALRQVPLHPALQFLLQTKGRKFSPVITHDYSCSD